jgi:hypothetical protein
LRRRISEPATRRGAARRQIRAAWATALESLRIVRQRLGNAGATLGGPGRVFRLTDRDKSLTLPLVLAASPMATSSRRTRRSRKSRTECAVRHGCRILVVGAAWSSVSQNGRAGGGHRGGGWGMLEGG